MANNEQVQRRELAVRLKEAREYLDFSQEEVAKILKCPRSAISLIENGERRVEAIELQRLAELYQRPVGYFTGEEAMPKESGEIALLARAASKLSDQDKEELLRFAEFLKSKASLKGIK